MNIFINECSCQEQFTDPLMFDRATRVLFTILDDLRQIKSDYKIYRNEESWYLYCAMENTPLMPSIRAIRETSLRMGLVNILFNKSIAIDWKTEQVHASEDKFICDGENITSTSIAELAERKIQDSDLIGCLLNFIESKYKDMDAITVLKNGEKSVDLLCIEYPTGLAQWLRSLLVSNKEYTETAEEPPTDEQTLLVDGERFVSTRFVNSGRKIYKEVSGRRYWYVDNLHHGDKAHLEVFDLNGIHIGEASISGVLKEGSQDRSKRLTLK